MRQVAFAAVVLFAVLGPVGASEAVPEPQSVQEAAAPRVVPRSSHPPTYRTRRSVRRTSRRPVSRPAGVTLPQLRTELARLEKGLGARVQRVERIASKPVPRPVVITPPPPPPPEPSVPLVSAAVGAATLSLLAGALGFVLGRVSSGHRSVARIDAVGATASDSARGHGRDATTGPWAGLARRLEQTQQQLAAARARLGRLERRV